MTSGHPSSGEGFLYRLDSRGPGDLGVLGRLRVLDAPHHSTYRNVHGPLATVSSRNQNVLSTGGVFEFRGSPSNRRCPGVSEGVSGVTLVCRGQPSTKRVGTPPRKFVVINLLLEIPDKRPVTPRKCT